MHIDESYAARFCLLRLKEMLFDFSLDSYRVPALNTYFRVQEALRHCREIETQSIAAESISPLVDEIEHFFKKDKVILATFDAEEVAGFSKRLRDSGHNISSISTLLHAILARLLAFDYIGTCQNLILKEVLGQRRLNRFDELLRIWASHAIAHGVSYQHIFYTIRQLLYSSEDIRANTIERLFEAVPMQMPSEFDVYVKCSTNFDKYIDDSGQAIAKVDDQAILSLLDKKRFHVSSDRMRIGKIGAVRAHDEYAAAVIASRKINTEIAFIHHLKPEEQLHWKKWLFVCPKDSLDGLVLRLPRSSLHKLPMTQERFLKQKLGKLAQQVVRVRRSSSTTLIRSFVSRSNAVHSSSPDSQLVALWSAFEILLPSPNEGIRINHFAKLLSPILTLFYMHGVSRYFVTEIVRVLGRKSLKVIKTTYPKEKLTTGVQLLLTHDEDSAPLMTLRKLVSGNPLLFAKFLELRDCYVSTEKLKDKLDNHEKKITWHLYRIYRTRNSIVHAGSYLPFITSINTSLHDYYQVILTSLATYTSRNSKPYDISEIVSEIRIDYLMLKDHYLAKKSSAAIEDVVRFMARRTH